MNMQHSIKDPAKELAQDPVATLVLPEETLGSLLQRARLAKRLQIDDVSLRLRFKPNVIQAMESDDFQSLGAPVFARMYLLRYSQLLGLPEHDILARYKLLGIDEAPPLRVNPSIKPQARSSDLRWLGYPLVFIVLGWLSWTGSQQFSVDPLLQKLGLADTAPTATSVIDDVRPALPQASASTTPPLLSAIGAELTSPAIATDTAPDVAADNTVSTANALPVEAILSQAESSNTATDPESVATDSAEPVMTPVETETALLSAAATDEPLSPVTLNDKHELLLEFSDDCWVEIKDSNGERLMYGIVKANEIRTVSGTLPFSVKLGNAHAARLKLDGRDVDKALYIPSRGSVSRFSLESTSTAPNQG